MASSPDGSDWHHAPLHVFVPGTVYMVTGATLHKDHFYRGAERMQSLESIFFRVLFERGWQLRAWALFSNHYHFIAQSPDGDGDIGRLAQHLHSDAAKAANRLDETPGRQVWFQYWDKCLTFEKSYYPRLKYVMQNAVRHGLVRSAADYPYCSAGWFERQSSSSFRRKVASFGCDRLNEPDDFEPVWEP